jgi:xanthosine utilization system XapX-like protein
LLFHAFPFSAYLEPLQHVSARPAHGMVRDKELYVSVRTSAVAVSIVFAVVTLRAAAPPVLTESLVGRQVFPTSNWWNADITAAPVDARSAALIDFISGRTPTNMTPIRRLHPDFGPPPYGFPYIVVAGDQPRVLLAFGAYGDESDTGAPGLPGYPIPDEARTQPHFV